MYMSSDAKTVPMFPDYLYRLSQVILSCMHVFVASYRNSPELPGHKKIITAQCPLE